MATIVEDRKEQVEPEIEVYQSNTFNLYEQDYIGGDALNPGDCRTMDISRDGEIRICYRRAHAPSSTIFQGNLLKLIDIILVEKKCNGEV